MKPWRALILSALAVYIVASGRPEMSFAAVESQFQRLDNLHKAALTAYEGTDQLKFEQAFHRVVNEYRRLNRPQEEIWALYQMDFDLQASMQEEALRLRLATEPVIEEEPWALGKARVRKVKLQSGVWAVVRIPGGITPSVNHDVMVYEISRLLGFHLVPVSTYRTYQNQVVSVQAFIEDRIESDKGFVREPYANEQLHILDFLTQQLDRHGGNWAVAPGGHVVAYDNDIVYGSEAWEGKRVWGPVSADTPPRAISPVNKKAIERLKKALQENSGRYQFPFVERITLLSQIEILLNGPRSCDSDLRSK